MELKFSKLIKNIVVTCFQAEKKQFASKNTAYALLNRQVKQALAKEKKK